MSNYGPSEAWLRDAVSAGPWHFLSWLRGTEVTEFADSAYPEHGPPQKAASLKEYQTDAGRIDLLLVIPERLLVVEFKKEVADEGAVAQCLRYIGALQSSGLYRALGVCVAPKFTDNAIYAADACGIAMLCITPSVDFQEPHAVESSCAPDALMRLVYPELFPEEQSERKTVVQVMGGERIEHRPVSAYN